MKRIISSILILVILLSLCSCTGKDENNKTQTNNEKPATVSEKQEEVAVGETIDKPEKQFDDENTEKLYLRFTMTDEDEYEIAYDEINDDTYILFASIDRLKRNDLVYEVSENEIKKYERSLSSQDEFDLSTSSYDTLKSEVESFMLMMAIFMYGPGETIGVDNLEYKKTGDYDAPGTGEAWMYDIYEDGEKEVEVMVNKETGLYSKIKTENEVLTLNEYKLSGFTIPKYK